MRILKNISFSFVLLLICSFIFSHGSYAASLSWDSSTSLPQTIDFATSVESNGYIYEIGGQDTSSYLSSVYYAQIQSNGTLGAWSTTTSLPQQVIVSTSVVYNGYIYEIGGDNRNGLLSSVYYAQIQSNGTLGVWNSTTSLPQTIDFATSVESNGYIYEIGGQDNSSYLSTVYYSQIQSNGTLGVWNSTTSLPEDTIVSTSVVYNGYIYEIGGDNRNGLLSSVYYSQIQSNGTLGVWNSTTSLPQTIDYATSIESSGYIYEIGGQDNSSYLSTVYYSQIKSNGTLGAWNSTTSLPQQVIVSTSVEYNGYIYEIGGENRNGLLSTVYNLPLMTGYSILGSNGNLYNFGTNNYGDMSNVPNGVPSKTGIGYAQTPNDLGYYILTSDGGIYTFGNAQFHGSVYNIPNAPVKTPVAIATTPHGNGYYVLTTDGGVYTFGSAQFHGSLFNISSSAIPDRTPVAFGVTPDGGGYYIVTQNGAVYTFGDAQFHGSTYNIPNAPVKTTVAFSLTPTGNGYYLVTKDGGVYTFGDAQFYGSMFNITNPPVRTPVSFKLSFNGLGYYIVTADGGVYTFGDANFLGSIAGIATPANIQ